MSEFITLNTIIGNGKSYQVPIYQRDYSWDKDDWEDLWNDILEIPKDKSHYLGYIVLQPISEPDQVYWVIDGQQRLTTISLLALAVTAILKKWGEEGIEPEPNKLRVDEETKRYLGNYSTSDLTTSPKLKLNRNNNDYYQSWLLAHRKPAALAKQKPSVRLLQKAFDYYYEKLDEMFSGSKSGAEITRFLEKTVGNGLVFTQIVVQNDLDAFKVFETLNARGVKLSTADLLKNYLFSLTFKQGTLELEEAERRWQNIVNALAKNDLTTYIRHFWNSRYKLERQPTLFKAIKREVFDPKSSFELLADLENWAFYYNAFGNPADELWDKEERKHLQVLNLLEISTCFPLMLAALAFLPRSEFKTVLSELVVITFRYNLSGLNPNEAERLFSSVANQIANGELGNSRNITLALKPIYVIDDNFEQAFSTMSISTKRKKELVKYILIKMENQISGTDLQPEDATSTIEHILPENPGSVWEASFPIDLQDENIYRLGNYTLLQASANNKMDNNLSFEQKSSTYQKSKFLITKDHLIYNGWTPNTILLHQQKMAKWAKAIWKSAYI